MFFLDNTRDSTASRPISMNKKSVHRRHDDDDETVVGFSPRKIGMQHDYSAVGGIGGAAAAGAFHHYRPPHHHDSSDDDDDDIVVGSVKTSSSTACIPIGGGGGSEEAKMMANLRRHRQNEREREAYERELAEMSAASSSDYDDERNDFGGRAPPARYAGRDTDHVFGDFEMDEHGEDYEEEDVDEDVDDEEPVGELMSLGGGTRRVPRTPRRKSSSKCGFYDFYKLTDEHLGAGAYGSVTTCKSKTSGEEFAVKIVDKQGETHSRKRILREVSIFKKCKGHANIVQLVDWFEDEDNFYLVMEKMRGGPLLQHILSKGYFTEEEARRVTKDIASALKFMHDRGIAHRDVKPENVLCTDPNRVSPVKLCDLDLASQRRPQSSSYSSSHVEGGRFIHDDSSVPDLASPVGSAEFMAPEVVDAFEGDGLKYDKKCDTWSLGVILYIMLAGYAPFQGECSDPDCGWSDGQPCDDCQGLLFNRIQDGHFEFPEEEWGMISDDAKDLVSCLLKRDPSKRYNADQILAHRWLQQSAPSIQLQTPNNLVYRKDSARDIQLMSQHFNTMNRLTDARRLSARFDSNSMMTMSECTADTTGNGSFLTIGGEPFGTFPRKRSVGGIAIEKPTPENVDFTPPISRASPTTPPPSMLNLSMDTGSPMVNRRHSTVADDSGFSLFSPISQQGIVVGSPAMLFVDVPPIQMFGDNAGELSSVVQMTPRHTTEEDESNELKAALEEAAQETAKPIRRIETQVNV